jgi:hypothetical protein
VQAACHLLGQALRGPELRAARAALKLALLDRCMYSLYCILQLVTAEWVT